MAAFDVFLKLDGIDGESNDAKHKDEIDIESFQWGLSQSGTFAGGGGGGAGKASFQDFSFTANISKASPQLFLACATGEHIKEGTITVRKSGKDQQEYYTVKLSDCLVSLYNQAAVAAGDSPQDEFALNYAKIEVTYKPQNADGSLGTPIRAAYDVRGNTKF
jgi:type VI secretion system secreted protein Hcp